MDEIKVYVIDKGRRYLYMRFTDPTTGKVVERSTGTAKRSDADKAAGAWEKELANGQYQKPSRMTWEAFRDYYNKHALPSVARTSAATYEATLNAFERLCTPRRLADVTTARITAFVTELRNESAAEATIARHLRGLKAAIRWAHHQGLMTTLPKFSIPKQAKGAKVMRGRPISGEEYDRMLASVEAVVESTAAPSWKFYLTSLWESGLRLSESLTLRWDEAPGAITIDYSQKYPMFKIPAEVEKGGRDRLLPMTPEFATLLETVPERERRGRVFKLLKPDGGLMPDDSNAVGRVISAIGERAGVIVDERLKRRRDDKGKQVVETVYKYASAHDLRRAFGRRWSLKVMPTVLRELMRHATITTTLDYYVGQNAEATAELLWNASGDTLGDTSRQAENRNHPRHAK